METVIIRSRKPTLELAKLPMEESDELLLGCFFAYFRAQEELDGFSPILLQRYYTGILGRLSPELREKLEEMQTNYIDWMKENRERAGDPSAIEELGKRMPVLFEITL